MPGGARDREVARCLDWACVLLGMLDILVPHPGLDRSGIMAGVGQGVAASVPEHVGMDREWHARAFA
jgi:hypothetical protein